MRVCHGRELTMYSYRLFGTFSAFAVFEKVSREKLFLGFGFGHPCSWKDRRRYHVDAFGCRSAINLVITHIFKLT